METLLILQPLKLGWPEVDSFFVVNFACLLAVVTYCTWRFWQNSYVLSRLSFAVTAMGCIFYQAPMVLFSEALQQSLQHPWRYAITVNSILLCLILFNFFSRRLDADPSHRDRPANLIPYFLVFLACGAVTVSIYLLNVKWTCTGLYALLYDPWLTLLAREFGIKIVGTSIATYSLGAYANAVAPALALTSIWLSRSHTGMLKAALLLSGLVIGFSSIVGVLIAGTKGLLVPMLIMLTAGAYFWTNTWRSRIFAMSLSMVFLFGSLIGFELFKERSSVVGEKYDFASCSVQAGTCERSIELIQSTKHRDFSLGIPASFIKPIEKRLLCMCGGPDARETCAPGFREGVKAGGLDDKTLADALAQVSHRSSTFAEAVFNRVFAVPFQVSVWTAMYAETEVVDGALTLPFARRLFGESLNIPELVYQKYGAVYSLGDRTSTSTAPTSFLFAYPAFLGFAGFSLAVTLLICLDLVVALLTRTLSSSMAPYCIGFCLIIAMNFMTSDFVTVMVSHGGAASILLLAASRAINGSSK